MQLRSFRKRFGPGRLARRDKRVFYRSLNRRDPDQAAILENRRAFRWLGEMLWPS